MKASQFSDEQIVQILRQAERDDQTIGAVCRAYTIAETTFYRWRKQFGGMMLNKGNSGNERILSRPSVELITSDQLTPEQPTDADSIFRGNSSWGFGMAVYTRRDDLMAVPGRFGWDGGLGTSGYSDPTEDLVGVLMTQLAWTSPRGPQLWSDFWTSVYQSIDD